MLLSEKLRKPVGEGADNPIDSTEGPPLRAVQVP